MKVTEKLYEHSLEVIERYLKGRDIQELTVEDRKDLDFHSDIVEAYELEHYPIEMPELKDVIRLRMAESNLKQKDLANLLEVPASRISEFFKGKSSFTLEVAKKLHKRLNIDADIILQ